MSTFPDSSTLVGLAEVCMTLLGFVGVVVVLGHRSTGDWDRMEQVRFSVMITASIAALGLCLLPLVLSEVNALHFAVAVCTATLLLIARGGWEAYKHPGGNNLVAAIIILCSLVLFTLVGLSDIGVLALNKGSLYLSAIFYHIAVAGIFFIRLIIINPFDRKNDV